MQTESSKHVGDQNDPKIKLHPLHNIYIYRTANQQSTCQLCLPFVTRWCMSYRCQIAPRIRICDFTIRHLIFGAEKVMFVLCTKKSKATFLSNSQAMIQCITYNGCYEEKYTKQITVQPSKVIALDSIIQNSKIIDK